VGAALAGVFLPAGHAEEWSALGVPTTGFTEDRVTTDAVARSFTRAGDRAKARAQRPPSTTTRPSGPARHGAARARTIAVVVRAAVVVLLAGLCAFGPSGIARAADGDPPTSPPTTAPPTTAPPTTAPPTTAPPTTAPPTTAPTTTGPSIPTTTKPTDASSTTTTSTTTPDSTTTTRPGSTTTTAPGDPTFTDFGELPPEELDLINRYREIQKGAADLLAQLELLNGGIAGKQADLTKVQARLDDAEKRLDETERQLAETEDQLDAQREQLRQRAVASYIGGPKSFGSGTAILKSTSVDDLEKSIAYGGAIVEDERTLIERTTELKGRVAALNRKAENEAAEAQQAHDDLVGEQGALEKQRDAVLSAEAGLQKNAQDKVKLLSEAAQRQIAVEAGFAKIDSIRDGIAGTLAKRQVDQVPPASTLGIFLSPISHPRINQPFGASYDPLFQVSRGHPGVDLNGAIGDPIRAPADGEVVGAGWVDGYGNCTIIDHGNAIGTLYGHQSVLLVKEGDKVTRGQVIGLVGSTGYSTGPHLHWEVRVRGNVVDPLPFVGDQS
jgi:murein DD-endopeptidase MepM/ murein hydrolase activator NlpD